MGHYDKYTIILVLANLTKNVRYVYTNSQLHGISSKCIFMRQALYMDLANARAFTMTDVIEVPKWF